MRDLNPTCRSASLRLGLLLLALLLPGAGAVLAEPGYEYGTPSPGGTGKVYMGREIARYMSFHGAAWLERAEREREERPDLLMPLLKLEPGMTVADIGAGTGYHARRIARLVGPEALVYAVDIQPEMLDLLERRASAAGLDNVRTVLGEADDPRLGEETLDVALVIDVYHELEFPHEMVQRIEQALRPGGRLVLVEYKAEGARIPIHPLHKMTEAQIRAEMQRHALAWERTERMLPWQHVVVFRKPVATGADSPRAEDR